MNHRTLALLVSLAAVASAQDKPKRIPDGTAQTYKGVSFDIPKSWTVQQIDAGTALVPAGANPSGVLEEGYVLVNDPTLKALDGDAFDKAIRRIVDEVHPGAARAGGVDKRAYGDVEGRFAKYTGATDEGAAIEIRIHAFMGDSGACALVAFGLAKSVSKRDSDLSAILGSMSRGGGGAAAGGGDGLKKAKRIAGGTANAFKRIAYDLPSTWKQQKVEWGVAIVPDGSNASGVLEEGYGFVEDDEATAMDGAAFERGCDEVAAKLQPGVKRDGAIEKREFGDVEGRVVRYKGEAGGKAIEVRLYVFMGAKYVNALVALGYADKIAARDKDLEAILGSMRPGPKGNVARELAGSWAHMTNVNAQNGGRRTESVLSLAEDGTYSWRAESNWSGPAGFGFTAQSESGTWTATDSTLTLRTSGAEKVFNLEKRNHPKNKSDPMIVLDGECFVTVYRKDPW